MPEENKELEDELFAIIVMNFQSSAMISMGKIIHPITKEITRNLSEAKFAIDIINMIIKRQYYKRIVTIHDDQEPPAGRRSFIQKFRVAHKKAGFNEALRNKIMDYFIDYTRNHVTDNSYFRMDDKDKIIQLLSKPYSILSDCPDPSYGGTELLNIIPEPQRLYKNYFSRVHTGETASIVWNNIYFKLMNIAAKMACSASMLCGGIFIMTFPRCHLLNSGYYAVICAVIPLHRRGFGCLFFLVRLLT